MITFDDPAAGSMGLFAHCSFFLQEEMPAMPPVDEKAGDVFTHTHTPITIYIYIIHETCSA